MVRSIYPHDAEGREDKRVVCSRTNAPSLNPLYIYSVLPDIVKNTGTVILCLALRRWIGGGKVDDGLVGDNIMGDKIRC